MWILNIVCIAILLVAINFIRIIVRRNRRIEKYMITDTKAGKAFLSYKGSHYSNNFLYKNK